MRKPPRLQRRRQTWYVRVRVPDVIRPVVGKAQVVRSLGTRDYVEACRRLPLASAEVEALFARARAVVAKGPSRRVDPHQAKAMVLAWFWKAERRAQLEPPPDDLREAAAEAAEEAAWLGDPNDPGVLASAQGEANRLLAAMNAAPDRGGADYWRVVELVRRGMVEQARRRRARMLGDFRAWHDPMYRGVRPEDDPPPRPEPRRLSVDQLIEAYMADPARAGVTAKTRLDDRFAFKVLRELVGADTVARDVGRQHARAVRDLLAGLPANSSKRWPGAPLQRVAQMAQDRGLEPMAPRTANAILGKLGALWNWGVREEHLPRNIFAGLRMAKPEVHAREARLPFSTDQLRRLFGLPYTDLTGARRWVPMVALFAGLRLNEACSLRVEDVQERDGVPCILVRPGDGRRLKTASARRLVPVHPEMVRLGLLAYVADRRGAGDEHLFPELRSDKRGYQGDGLADWFNRTWMSAVGAVAPRTSFHSFRHCFRDALREANAPRDAVLALGGWSTGQVADDYGAGLRPRTLARWIRRVRYPGLLLDHLVPARARKTADAG